MCTIGKKDGLLLRINTKNQIANEITSKLCFNQNPKQKKINYIEKSGGGETILCVRTSLQIEAKLIKHWRTWKNWREKKYSLDKSNSNNVGEWKKKLVQYQANLRFWTKTQHKIQLRNRCQSNKAIGFFFSEIGFWWKCGKSYRSQNYMKKTIINQMQTNAIEIQQKNRGAAVCRRKNFTF